MVEDRKGKMTHTVHFFPECIQAMFSGNDIVKDNLCKPVEIARVPLTCFFFLQSCNNYQRSISHIDIYGADTVFM